MIRIGHKGADALVPGNTIASFQRAVEIGVDMVEIDVLWIPDGDPDLPARERSPLVVAHDWHDATGRDPHTLDQVLDAFTRAPLDRVELDLDIKLPGREDEIVDALHNHGLIERAMVSGMDLPAIDRVGRLESGLRLGWTYPQLRRAWDRVWWAKPFVARAVARMRRRLPRLLGQELPNRGIHAVWVLHRLLSAEAIGSAREHEVAVMAWTVDDPRRMAELRTLGVTGICTNDPRLFAELPRE